MDLTRYRKIIIYVLTFLAYAWSGYGTGLLSNLRDAVLAAETVFHDFFANAITVARKIKDIHEVFDAAVEENCVFQCPDGAYLPGIVISRPSTSQLSGYLPMARRHWSIPRSIRAVPLIPGFQLHFLHPSFFLSFFNL